MMSRALAALLVLAACSDPATPLDIKDQLAALPGVTVAEWFPPADFGAEDGYRYFDLTFTQPIDHGSPGTGTFQQYAALMWVDDTAPLVLYTSGYGAGWKRYLAEPSQILRANQLSLEYRFYERSRPAADWSKLTVQQNADDEHAILKTIAPLYSGKTIQTGGSKGGENSMFHAWLYPDDLDGVVAYVPPVITDFPDARYATVLDDIGANVPECRDALRALQRELLNRRAAMEMRADLEAEFTIAGVAHATETAIVELEFSFWMTRGEPDCAKVPPTTATDDDLFAFFDQTGGPYLYGDHDLGLYGQQYIFQDHLELGYPVWQHAHLDDLLVFSYEDWSAYLPTATPAYDPQKPRGLADWLATSPPHIMIVGGGFDPWGPGYPQLTIDADTRDYIAPRASHWSASIYALDPAQKVEAIDALKQWAGVTTHREPGPPRATMAFPDMLAGE
ncbi:MAG TPA: S28 family serine protease [Kofleriaceae bacterium]|nr:S28 family serine protease [Kofleriaceae bacterium]